MRNNVREVAVDDNQIGFEIRIFHTVIIDGISFIRQSRYPVFNFGTGMDTVYLSGLMIRKTFGNTINKIGCFSRIEKGGRTSQI